VSGSATVVAVKIGHPFFPLEGYYIFFLPEVPFSGLAPGKSREFP